MKTNIMLPILMLFSMHHLSAQNSLNTAGGEISGETGYVSFTIGQNITGKTSGDEGVVNAFIQQSYDISVITDATQEEKINLTISTYPNPTTDLLIIEINNIELDHFNYSVYDISGREICSNNINSNKTQISLNTMETGTYLVNVSDKYKQIKTFQIVKN